MLATQLAAAQAPREPLSLDAGWRFHLGDDWPDALHLENSGTGSGPTAEKFSDSYWRVVKVPHDWAVELPFDWAADGSHGFKTLGTKYPTNSIAWYRRTFELPKADEGTRIWLTFDGIFRDATVWVNGWCVRHHEGGYFSFREDITDVLHFDGKNTIAVRVDATKVEGWFYEGASIYRHVWLDKTAPVAPDSPCQRGGATGRVVACLVAPRHPRGRLWRFWPLLSATPALPSRAEERLRGTS